MTPGSDFHIARFTDNRIKGLVRELLEAIDDEKNEETLRRLGTSLRDIGSAALNKHRDIVQAAEEAKRRKRR